MNLNTLTNDELVIRLYLRNDLTDTERLLVDRLSLAVDTIDDLEAKVESLESKLESALELA